jgi:hypothetical protein
VALVSKFWHAVEVSSPVLSFQPTINIPESEDLWRLSPAMLWHSHRHNLPALQLHSTAADAFFSAGMQIMGLQSLTLSDCKYTYDEHWWQDPALHSKWRSIALLSSLKVPPIPFCTWFLDMAFEYASHSCISVEVNPVETQKIRKHVV